MTPEQKIKAILNEIILENEGDRYDIYNNVLELINPLIEGLKNISEPSGAYSRDPLQHANNTIQNCSSIAMELLENIGNP